MHGFASLTRGFSGLIHDLASLMQGFADLTLGFAALMDDLAGLTHDLQVSCSAWQDTCTTSPA